MGVGWRWARWLLAGIAAWCCWLTWAAPPPALAQLRATPAATPPPTPLWSIGATTPLPQFNAIDIEPGILRADGAIWLIYSDGGNTWRRFTGPALDDLAPLPPARRDASFNQPYGDDRYWISGLWSDGATWYATVHIEFHYHAVPNDQFNWFRRIGLATSSDQGATWHYAGDIITGPHSVFAADFAGDRYDWGDGDQKFFVDTRGGYFYIYYETGWITKATGAREQFIDVARCPIAEHMAPGCWTKWYDGAWDQPGLGGLDSAVFSHENTAAIVYSTALRAYVAIGDGPSFISVAASLERQEWSAPTPFVANDQLEWYLWPVDPLTGDRMTVGASFRLYLAQSGMGLETKYLAVTLYPATRPQVAGTRPFPT